MTKTQTFIENAKKTKANAFYACASVSLHAINVNNLLINELPPPYNSLIINELHIN